MVTFTWKPVFFLSTTMWQRWHWPKLTIQISFLAQFGMILIKKLSLLMCWNSNISSYLYLLRWIVAYSHERALGRRPKLNSVALDMKISHYSKMCLCGCVGWGKLRSVTHLSAKQRRPWSLRSFWHFPPSLIFPSSTVEMIKLLPRRLTPVISLMLSVVNQDQCRATWLLHVHLTM